MSRDRLEAGDIPDIEPQKDGRGGWVIPQTYHRTWSGKLVRSTGRGKTRAACKADYKAKAEAKNGKGSVLSGSSRRRTWSKTDKMSDAFAHWFKLQEQRVARGELTQGSLNDYRRFTYRIGEKASRTAVRLDPEMGQLTVGECGRPVFLADYLDAVASDYPALAKVQYDILASVFRMLVLGGAFDQSPMFYVPELDKTSGSQRSLLANELAAVPQLWRPARGRSEGDYIRPVVLTMLGTGVRPGEALALRRSDVADRDEAGHRIISINGHILPKVGRVAGRKSGPNYQILAPQWLTAELDEWEQRLPASDPDRLLFLTRSKRPLCVSEAGRSLISRRVDTPLDWLTFGNLRDTVATEVADFYDDDKRASAQLGHSEAKTLAQRHYIDTRGRSRRYVDNVAALESLAVAAGR